MVTRTKIDELDLTVDRFHALEAEVERLRIELAEEQAHSASLKRLVDKAKERIRELDNPQSGGVDLGFGSRAEAVADEPAIESRGRKAKRRGGRKKRGIRSAKKQAANVYVFDDQDEAMIAFDEFFANPDPDLDKVRGFLLD